MSLARSLLLQASRSEWLAEQFRRRAFAQRAVKRFMPGEDLESALQAAAEFGTVGIGTILTELGERVTSRSEAAAVRDHYLGVLKSIRERFLPSVVSVKLTHLGLDGDRAACIKDVMTLAEAAGAEGSFLWIDMEESNYVDATLEVFRQVRAVYENVGVALQAYLRRTAADVDALLPLKPAIRLVKGAYNEPPLVAFPAKRDTDANYFALGSKLLEAAGQGRASPVFGTHDLGLIARLRERATQLKVSPTAYEFALLYGIRAADQQRLAAQGAKVRVLISYGSAWFAWYLRRLAERPANVWFVARSLF